MSNKGKTGIIIAVVVAVTAVAAYLVYKYIYKKNPEIEIEELELTEFANKRAYTLLEDMTVGQIITLFANTPKKEAFTVEWFCGYNPKYSTANARTVIPAGKTIYYPN